VAAYGSVVQLMVAKAYPRVPGVSGKGRKAAIHILKRADYKVRFRLVTTTTGRDGTVLSQTPQREGRGSP
jgi:beta-lactam-binding protein with PASTA domain